MRFTILRIDSVDSTNLEAMRQAKAGAAEGLCVVAREQTQGRGRQERVWVSPRDAGLYFSIVLRPQFDIQFWPLITLMAALSVTDALRDACKLQTDIKWPNDIVIGERKLCGILAETVETGQGLACVLGIGINLTAEAIPPELVDRATSVASVTGAATDSDALMGSLLDHLSRHYRQLGEVDGPAALIRDWTAASSFARGKRIRVDTGIDSFEGITEGLESDGGLRVKTTVGDLRVVRAGDVQSVRPVSS